MAVISLQKGQKIDLTKGNAGLTQVVVGLGWDPVKQSSSNKGFFGGLLGGGSSPEIDCDASVIMVDANNKIIDKNHLIYFGNKTSPCRSVIHSGDNLTGGGDGDDEQIQVNLSQVPIKVNKIVFVVNIYDCVSRKQHFGMIANCFIRVFNPQSGNAELCRYNLSDDYSGKASLIVGEIYRHNGEWKFSAVGEGTSDTSISSLVIRY